MKKLIIAAAFIYLLMVSFLFVAALTRVVCYAFDLEWHWKISVGVYVSIILVGLAVKICHKRSN